jgi:hypothetical protein
MITIDARPFDDSMRRISQEIGVGMGEVVKWQMGLWCADIIKKIGQNRYNISTLGSQKRRGETTVEQHVKRVFDPIPEDADVWADRKNDRYGVREKGSRKTWFVSSANWKPGPTSGEMEALHDAQRVDGYVSSLRKSQMYGTRARAVEAYALQKMQHVGRCKAAWLKAYRFFSSSAVFGAKFNPPSWVTRHEGWGSSRGSCRYSNGPNGPSAEASSTLAWGSDPEAIVEMVGRTRWRDLCGKGKGSAIWRMREIMKKYQSRQVAS